MGEQELSVSKNEDAASGSDVEKRHHHSHDFEDDDHTALAQLVGVGILEFGVILHRCVSPCFR